MGVIVAESDPAARETLKRLTREMGVAPLAEARDGHEALEMVRTHRSRARFLLCALDLPRFHGAAVIERIALLPELSQIACLLMLDGENRTPIRGGDRIDALLQKPFASRALSVAMQRAYRTRAATRSTVVYVGIDDHTRACFESALGTRRRDHWRRLVCIDSREAVEALTPEEVATFGVLFVDPLAKEVLGRSWLSLFETSLIGQNAVVVALGKLPELLMPIRSQCHLCVPSPVDARALLPHLARLSARVLSTWERELLFTRFREAQRANRTPAACAHATALVKLDPENTEGLWALATTLEAQGRTNEAIERYEEAVRLNPCFPRPYIKLMELLEKWDAGRRALEIAEQACLYCPDHVGTLKKAADLWERAGNLQRANLFRARAEGRHHG